MKDIPTAAAFRGHDLLPDEILLSLPALYSTEETPPEHTAAHVHFFCPVFDWYLVEFDPDDRYCFGYVYNRSNPTLSEWGYFHLDELEALFVARPHAALPLYVERDMHWTPRPMAEVSLGLGQPDHLKTD